MGIAFKFKDVIHKIAVKFIPAYLPEAKKAFNLRAVHQPELDVHAIAGKAKFYNISESPEVIEKGLLAGMKLIYCLVADGYRVKTPLFNLKLRIPGEYSGRETALAPEVFPVARFRASSEFRQYLKDTVKLEIDGVDNNKGFIAEARDEASGLMDEKLTPGNLLTIRGYGLKIDSDYVHQEQAGVFFKPQSGAPIKAAIVSLNESKTLKVIIPPSLVPGTSYTIAVETMSSIRGRGTLLKKMRDMQSEFTMAA